MKKSLLKCCETAAANYRDEISACVPAPPLVRWGRRGLVIERGFDHRNRFLLLYGGCVGSRPFVMMPEVVGNRDNKFTERMTVKLTVGQFDPISD